MTEIREVLVQTIAEPAAITLTKNSKGYGWEIKVHSETLTKAVDEVKRIDDLMRERYGECTTSARTAE